MATGNCIATGNCLATGNCIVSYILISGSDIT